MNDTYADFDVDGSPGMITKEEYDSEDERSPQ